MSAYAKKIASICESKNLTGCEPRLIEAWMRDEHSTLDHLSAAQFASAVITARLTALDAGSHLSDELARSYGL